MNFGKIDNFVLLGGGSLVVHLIEELKKLNQKIILITGQRNLDELISPTSITFSQHLKENKIDYLVSENVNEDSHIEQKITSNTLGISLGAPWILKEKFIKKFGGKLLNVHGARLPQDRGGGTTSWQILRNNKLGFCLIHKIEPGIDTGPIIKFKEFFYPPNCKVPKTFQEFYINENILFLREFINEILVKKDFDTINQPEYLSIYWPRLSTEHHSYIDWNWTLEEIELFIDAFDNPYKGASTFINNQRVFVKNCLINYNDGCFHPFQQGIVYRKSIDSLFIAAKNGTLILRDVKDEKGNNILDRIKIGDRFFTPFKFLEEAKKFRAIYTSKGLKETSK